MRREVDEYDGPLLRESSDIRLWLVPAVLVLVVAVKAAQRVGDGPAVAVGVLGVAALATTVLLRLRRSR